MDYVEKTCIAAIVIIVLVAALAGYQVGRESIRKEAILQGHAHYYYDYEGTAKFKWTECIHF
jgi:glycine betaine/choline ABC-type transport system substrate-binding protein